MKEKKEEKKETGAEDSLYRLILINHRHSFNSSWPIIYEYLNIVFHSPKERRGSKKRVISTRKRYHYAIYTKIVPISRGKGWLVLLLITGQLRNCVCIGNRAPLLYIAEIVNPRNATTFLPDPRWILFFSFAFGGRESRGWIWQFANWTNSQIVSVQCYGERGLLAWQIKWKLQ